MRRYLLAAFMVLSATSPAFADEQRIDPEAARRACIYGPKQYGPLSPGDQIAACDAAIASRNYDGEDLAWIYNARALLRAEINQFDQAFADFALAIAAKPDLAFLYSNRSQVRMRRHEVDLALADLNQAIAIEPSNTAARINRAALLMGRGDNDGALVDLNEAIRLSPHAAIALYNRGRIYLNQRKDDLALADFNTVITIDPQHWRAYGSRGDIEMSRGQLDAAIADYKREQFGLPDEDYGIGRLALARIITGRELESALSDVDRLLSRRPTYGYAIRLRAMLLIKLARWDEAIAECDRLIKYFPKFAEAWYGRGLARQKKGDNEGAADITAALALDPNIAKTYATNEQERGYGPGAPIGAFTDSPNAAPE